MFELIIWQVATGVWSLNSLIHAPDKLVRVCAAVASVAAAVAIIATVS